MEAFERLKQFLTCGHGDGDEEDGAAGVDNAAMLDRVEIPENDDANDIESNGGNEPEQCENAR